MVQDLAFETTREDIKLRILNRSFGEKLALFVRRLISTIINLAFILVGIYAVIYVQDNDEQFVKYILNELPMLKPQSQFLPTLMISAFNSLIPAFTKLIVLLERYDFPETTTQQEIWRNYIAKMLSLFIFVLVSYKGVIDLSLFDEMLGTNFKRFNVATDECKYDGAGVAFLSLAITEIGTLVVVETGLAFARRVFFQRILGHALWQEVITKKLSDFCIWILYNKAVHWLILLNMPYFVLVNPLIDYLSFIFLHFIIRTFYQKSPKSSDIGFFLIILMNVTFWLNIL